MLNPTTKAFADAMKSEHRDLAVRVQSLRACLCDAADRGWPTAAAMHACQELGALEVLVREHFAREEQGGYLEEALAHAPRFGPEAETLLAEHDALLVELRQVLSRAREAQHADRPDWADLTSAVAAFLRKLVAHEAQENRLLHKAFNLDAEAV